MVRNQSEDAKTGLQKLNILVANYIKKRKRKIYLYEMDESVKNGHGPSILAIRMLSNSYNIR